MNQPNAIPHYETKAGGCLFAILAFAATIISTLVYLNWYLPNTP